MQDPHTSTYHYSLGTEVFFLEFNKVKSGVIIGYEITCGELDGKKNKNTRITYRISHSLSPLSPFTPSKSKRSDDTLFLSKEELLASL